MSALCQKQAFCAAVENALFDRLLGRHRRPIEANRNSQRFTIICLPRGPLPDIERSIERTLARTFYTLNANASNADRLLATANVPRPLYSSIRLGRRRRQ